jgi:serpin B
MNTTTIPTFLLAAASLFAQEPNPVPADAKLLAAACNRFGAALHAQLQPASNPTLSPASIALALLLLEPGARGTTHDELAKVLQLPAELRGKRLHDAAHALLQASSLVPTGEPNAEAPLLRLANDLWNQQGNQLVPDYLQVLRRSLLAGQHEVDFHGDSEAARRRINAHVAKATNDRIRDLLPKDLVDASTELVLTNALWLKAAWLHPFMKGGTTDDPFHLANGEAVAVPTMHTIEEFAFAESAHWQAVVLPFAGGTLQAEFLVPKQGTELAVAERALLAGEHRQALQQAQVHVQLPRFRTASKHRLKEPLQALGLRAAFDGEKVDFRGITPTNRLVVADVVHQTWVQCDEAGVEAAAATAVVMKRTAAPGGLPKHFVADRPFAFLLRDVRTDLVLFAGRVADPRGETEDTNQRR